MSNKGTNTAEAAKKPDTLKLLEKMFAEIGATLRPVNNNLYAFTYGRQNDDNCYSLLIEVYEDSFFIKIIDLDWHKVSMDNIEEVTKIHTAINKFNREGRAKGFYKCHDDGYMTLSTIMYCPLLEEIPDIHRYFNIQLDTLTDARDYVLSPEKLNDLPFWYIQRSPQSKSSKEIVLEALEELHCTVDVQIDNDFYCSAVFDYQDEYFGLGIYPTEHFIKIDAISEYVCDFDIDMLSAVRDLVNDTIQDFRVPFDYMINKSSYNDSQYIDIHSFIYLPCVEGKCFAKLLRETFWHCFDARNKFNRLWAMYYEK